jgi:hypothetical protein
MASQRFAWLIPGLLYFFLLGCKEASPVPVAVKGKAQYEGGKPVADMILTFHPQDESNKNTRPVQVTDKDGNFSLSCVKGRYKVTLAAVPKGTAGSGGPGGYVPGPEYSSNINSLYRDPEKTPWLIDVPETGKDNILLTLKAP